MRMCILNRSESEAFDSAIEQTHGYEIINYD